MYKGETKMKKLSSRLAALAMSAVLSSTVFAGAAFAADTPSDWAAGQVNEAISWGLIPEEIQGRYQDNITREEFAILMDEVCNDYSGGKGSFIFWDNYNSTDGFDPFTDTTSVEVRRMYCAGIMNGIGDGKFGPDQPVTREMAATIICNFGNFIGKPLPAGNVNFSDSASVSDWAVDSVGRVQAAGIMSGMGNNLFAPKEYYTREQSIITALKLYNYARQGSSYTGGNTGSTGGNTQSSGTVVTGGSFQEIFQQLYDGLSLSLDRIEIANATEYNWPSTDTFPKISSTLRSQYPEQEIAIGYLEAAREKMVECGAEAISIEVAGMMGYTASSYNRVKNQHRQKIDELASQARDYLERAKNAVR